MNHSTALTFATDHGAPPRRYLTPDLARGFMLLLIALANVAVWFPRNTSAGGIADRWWEVVQTGFIDGRAYPLFACLFGFGLATMVARRSTPDGDVAPTRRLLRRRGWWMLLFGFVHGLLFVGDIIGVYGLIAVLIAGAVAAGRLRWPVISAAVVMVIMTISTIAMGGGGPGPGAATRGGATGGPVAGDDNGFGLSWPLENIVGWSVGTVPGVVFSFALPCVVAGVALARTTLLRRPDEHLPLLRVVAVVGLGVGLLTSLPSSLPAVGLSLPGGTPWVVDLSMIGGLAGAAGWLALLGLISEAIGDRSPSSSWSPTAVLTAVGRRSMTAYIGQSVVFALTSFALAGLGWKSAVTPLGAAGIAVAAWVIMAIVCAWLAATGRQGPFERMLRWLVARS